MNEKPPKINTKEVKESPDLMQIEDLVDYSYKQFQSKLNTLHQINLNDSDRSKYNDLSYRDFLNNELSKIIENPLSDQELFDIDLKLRCLCGSVYGDLFSHHRNIVSSKNAEEKYKDNPFLFDREFPYFYEKNQNYGSSENLVREINEKLAVIIVTNRSSFSKSLLALKELNLKECYLTERTDFLNERINTQTNNLKELGLDKFANSSLGRASFIGKILNQEGGVSSSDGSFTTTDPLGGKIVIETTNYSNGRQDGSIKKFQDNKYENFFIDYLNKNNFVDRDNTVYDIEELLALYKDKQDLEATSGGVLYRDYENSGNLYREINVNKWNEQYSRGYSSK